MPELLARLLAEPYFAQAATQEHRARPVQPALAGRAPAQLAAAAPADVQATLAELTATRLRRAACTRYGPTCSS